MTSEPFSSGTIGGMIAGAVVLLLGAPSLQGQNPACFEEPQTIGSLEFVDATWTLDGGSLTSDGRTFYYGLWRDGGGG